ncbi:hypothetical protein [Cohnella herbarum]|uniref:Uncharacterized protein n=1 Tax=Cohnella herbarum TaxID=2728023 RepID=A0A7Z2ZJS5_9BACL|nr:hypothetical protein [Cohnella herbarum]QJD82178.1 hypothetical protein HH215_02605 [Cohnella herbarum]
MTLNQLIIGLRMEEAARLLKNPLHRSYEIANESAIRIRIIFGRASRASRSNTA